MKLSIQTNRVGKKLTLTTAAFILVMSTVTAMVPFLLSARVGATLNTTYASTTFGGLTWSADRSAPSGGYTVAANTLTENVKSDLTPVPDTFYLTEGVQAALPAGKTSVRAKLFIDPTWASKPVRA